tara:strand:+ start:5111 stop:6784 length:1674 start_codon:yes stop_codon:yes gene_type:complete
MAKEVLELEVKSNVKSVTKETDELGESLGKASDETKDLDKGLEETGKSGSKGFRAISTAVKGFGMALKAAGIGLVIALFVTLKEALERNQTVMNAVNTVMTTVSTTFNQVADVLIDVYDWVTKSSDRFDGLTKVISGLMTIALTPLKLAFYTIKLAVQGLMLAWEDSFLGGGDEGKIAELRLSIVETSEDIKEVGIAAIEAGKDIGKNIGDAIGEIGAIGKIAIKGISEISIKANYEQAKATTAAANSSKLAEAAIQGLIEKNDRLSELQRQIRDDETKTFAERIAANKELGEILDNQEKEMLALADTRVASAALELAANKDNIDLQVAYQQTLNDRAGVEAQIAGFRSEQLTNEVSLNKELLETQKEVRAEGLSGLELELQELQDAYDLKIKMAEKAGMETTAITKKFEAAKTKIVKDNENAKLAAISGFASAVNALAGEQKGIAVATALMNTYLGVTEVMKDPTIPSTTMKFLAAGTVLAGGLANVQNILKQDVGSGSGGGGGSIAAAPPAPQMMSGAFELTGGQETQPIQAYVVSDEITDSQNALAIIRRRATI